MLGLYVVGLGFAVAVAAGYEPASPWEAVNAIFRPIGEPFLRPLKG